MVTSDPSSPSVSVLEQLITDVSAPPASTGPKHNVFLQMLNPNEIQFMGLKIFALLHLPFFLNYFSLSC